MSTAEPGALYLFAFAPAGASAPDVAAVELGPVRSLALGALTAVVAALDPAPFTGPEGERNLADLGWLAPRVDAHRRVVDALLARGVVLPARFGTLFSSQAALEAWLAPRAGAIAAALERLAGKEEWGVRLAGRASVGPVPEADAAVSGADYLRRRQAARADAVAQQEAQSAQAETLERQLAGLASATARLRPRADGEGERPLLNLALLVAREDRSTFLDRTRRLADEAERSGITWTLTGPWPPYSFAELPEAL
jgi:hypothetical protein